MLGHPLEDRPRTACQSRRVRVGWKLSFRDTRPDSGLESGDIRLPPVSQGVLDPGCGAVGRRVDDQAAVRQAGACERGRGLVERRASAARAVVSSAQARSPNEACAAR
ncbi:hypothetical protein GCM10009646_10550 [Streptomyces aureus]